MGLDVGSKTIGVAVSDELGITAQGLKTIKRRSKDEDLKDICDIITRYEIGTVVVGLPKNLDGTLGRQAQTVLHWIDAIRERISVPVVTWDERLSTVGASRVLLEADLSRKMRKEVIDKLAAVLILQGYLNQMRSRPDESLSSA